jgi:nicotinamide mononucleotide transporter PnuC
MKFLKNYFKGFNTFDWIIFALAFIAPVTLGIIFKNDVLDIVTPCVAVITAHALAKGKVEGYFISLLSSALYIAVSVRAHTYGEAIHTVLIGYPVVIYGIFAWLKNKRTDKEQGSVVKVGKTGKLELLILCGSQAVMAVGYYFLLQAFNTEQVLFSTLSLVLVTISMYLLARRSALCWFSYIIWDLCVFTLWLLVVLDGSGGSAAVLAMPVLYLVTDIYGAISWLKLNKTQQKTLSQNDSV